MKLLEEIIIPYLEKQQNIENLAFDHHPLLILDVFKGQLTEPVLNELEDHNIFTSQVPSNMTHIFQPLDFRNKDREPLELGSMKLLQIMWIKAG